VSYGIFQRLFCCGHFILAVFGILASLLLTIASVTADQTSTKSVLVLFGERSELPAIGAVQQGLDAGLKAGKKGGDILRVPRFCSLSKPIPKGRTCRAFEVPLTLSGGGAVFHFTLPVTD
jgi:hypothetical protein